MESNNILQKQSVSWLNRLIGKRPAESAMDPFWVLVHKEITDHIKSWRFIILIALISLTCIGSMYTALGNISDALKNNNANDIFVFLKLYTVSDGTLPSFFVFVGFLGPLLGIGMGFDAVNSEMNKGTVNRILSQPIPRDYFINAKYTAALVIISVLFFALSFLVMGIGLIAIGIPPTPEEFIRILLFTIAAIIYVSFWLNLSILFSIKFIQPATSALTGISVWLFFSIFYNMLINVVFSMLVPAGRNLSLMGEKMKLNILQLAPNQLFNEITNVLLTPTVRSVGPLTMEQVKGAIPGPIPVLQSVMLIWPQIIGIIALTVICFVISYLLFMKREIRST